MSSPACTIGGRPPPGRRRDAWRRLASAAPAPADWPDGRPPRKLFTDGARPCRRSRRRPCCPAAPWPWAALPNCSRMPPRPPCAISPSMAPRPLVVHRRRDPAEHHRDDHRQHRAKRRLRQAGVARRLSDHLFDDRVVAEDRSGHGAALLLDLRILRDVGIGIGLFVLRIGHRAGDVAETTGLRRLGHEGGGDRRHKRLHRAVGLLPRQAELPREVLEALTALRASDHLVEVEQGGSPVLDRPRVNRRRPSRDGRRCGGRQHSSRRPRRNRTARRRSPCRGRHPPAHTTTRPASRRGSCRASRGPN